MKKFLYFLNSEFFITLIIYMLIMYVNLETLRIDQVMYCTFSNSGCIGDFDIYESYYIPPFLSEKTVLIYNMSTWNHASFLIEPFITFLIIFSLYFILNKTNIRWIYKSLLNLLFVYPLSLIIFSLIKYFNFMDNKFLFNNLFNFI